MRSLFASTLAVLVGGLSLSGLAAGCGDSSGEGGGGGGGNGAGLSDPGRICIDNATIATVNDETSDTLQAGLQIRFRVLDGNGDPVRPLDTSAESTDISIINNETNIPFGAGDEGDSISAAGPPSALELYSVLVLDMSHSIFQNGLEDDVLDGARAYITEALNNAPEGVSHKIAIFAIGSPDSEKQISTDFTSSGMELGGNLDTLRNDGDRGTTDLYTSYILALRFLEDNTPAANSKDLVVERFLVMISDGSHEAGNGAALRELALTEKALSPSTKIAIGLAGNLSPCALEELAGRPESDCQNPLAGCREGLSCNPETAAPASCTQYIPDVEGADIAEVFQTVATRALGIADSNYQVAVCTPVALGNSSLTLVIDVDGAQDAETLAYDADALSGNVQKCDPNAINGFEIPVGEGGGGAGGGPEGGGGAGGGDAGGGGAGTGGSGGAGGAGGAP